MECVNNIVRDIEDGKFLALLYFVICHVTLKASSKLNKVWNMQNAPSKFVRNWTKSTISFCLYIYYSVPCSFGLPVKTGYILLKPHHPVKTGYILFWVLIPVLSGCIRSLPVRQKKRVQNNRYMSKMIKYFLINL